ncbi:hypothetical protein [Proteiniclasticum ruminis]|uniref:Uncharacterized protein n=1 Tax=Proteiniclasticum ruminis TaxID=398199 RepID=A0A1I5DVE8_9CLOT|nr:hypothetical protein [Proteiniclasticum ruminis]SFO03156.1 hypothetical protein SAMN04488695_11136 [Proteiniclasticum ruminis]
MKIKNIGKIIFLMGFFVSAGSMIRSYSRGDYIGMGLFAILGILQLLGLYLQNSERQK